MYVGANNKIYALDKSASTTANGTVIMSVTSRCLDVFVDVNNTLYCCLDGENKVIKISLNNKSSSVSLAAGNGTSGNSSYLLNNPNGIFVDVNRDLYVADRSNNRIQLYRQGSLNGTTIHVTGALTPAGLLNPSGVTLDGDGYLFIVDRGYNRLLASGPNGFRCIAACSPTGTGGSESSQLKDPQKLWFDSFGNIVVIDRSNYRVQIFYLINNASTYYYLLILISLEICSITNLYFVSVDLVL
ncbi:unnamed protein product [Adineta ricciae]|uniref:NHL repeat protein n=1 Tax=Adineta ricciae TaxID=249248 RepID=A0A816A728_ADIRI|nr:unnamed protein product [Adineta ricciae]